MPVRNYKAEFGFAIKIYSVQIFILNTSNSAIWLVNTKPQNKQMHCRITPGRTFTCGYTMKISCRDHRLLIYDVKRTTKIDGMGPFNIKHIRFDLNQCKDDTARVTTSMSCFPNNLYYNIRLNFNHNRDGITQTIIID